MLFELRQSLLLLLTATIWGLSFVAQSVGMDHVGPFTFTSSRMALGTLVLLPWVFLARRRLARNRPDAHAERSTPAYRKQLLLGGFLCGLCLLRANRSSSSGSFTTPRSEKRVSSRRSTS